MKSENLNRDLINIEDATDPLDRYSREDLLELIESQSEENNDLRQRAVQFEHLYRDVMTSTAWKLSWPIRASFKVLMRVKQKLTGHVKPVAVPSAARPISNWKHSGIIIFDPQLPLIKTFASSTKAGRINLLLTQRLTEEQLANLIKATATAATQLKLSLRILTLDPLLTARHCAYYFPKNLVANFHRVETSINTKNDFRIDLGTQEWIVVQTEMAQKFASRLVNSQHVLLVDPNAAEVDLSSTLIQNFGKEARGIE